ncbi:hypothetical protein Agau_C201609 [Agrobacterium tumefaciens F2]|nr:hypothetical protein Agau_C201609 [Agrobacterium tumefaciens F2]
MKFLFSLGINTGIQLIHPWAGNQCEFQPEEAAKKTIF